ncbi:MAG TPA: cupin domain-containing protein [Candidatus Dormibacteraeota bacterium]|nr:cupin domain-containing protein [Candidatus Dormibacteraeota bacterium]
MTAARAAGARLAFPGATALTLLEVYDWPGPDGRRGGSAHVHLACSEAYFVLDGRGRLETLGAEGHREVPLRGGDCLWFTPGTVHRLINDDALRILVVMQNAGLPEAGDAVFTFPPDVLADPERYAAAAGLPAGDEETLEAAARRRRDLSVEGYLALRARVAAEGPGALGDFLAAAVRLVADRVPEWRRRWRGQAPAVAALTGRYLEAIQAGRTDHLGGVLLRSPGRRAYGMCGRLTTYAAPCPPGPPEVARPGSRPYGVEAERPVGPA